MAEFKISRFRYTWRGQWVAGDSTTYNKDDVVLYQGRAWVCIRQHAPSVFDNDLTYTAPEDTLPSPAWVKMTDGQKFLGNWAQSTYYDPGVLVIAGGNLWQCVGAHQSTTNFSDNILDWEVFASGSNFRDTWTQSTRYVVGDVIRYNGYTYQCVLEHTSDNSSVGVVSGSGDFNDDSTAETWKIVVENYKFVGSYANSTRYRVNDLVKYGGSIFKCIEEHTTNPIPGAIDSSKFSTYLLGYNFYDDWVFTNYYAIGDVVRKGGSVYIAVQNNVNSEPGLSTNFGIDNPSWSRISKSTNFRGAYSSSSQYFQGDLVRRGGSLWISLIDQVGDNSTLNVFDISNWEFVIPSYNYRGSWNQGQLYNIKDIVLYRGSTYSANTPHLSEFNNFPGDNGEAFVYWDLLVQGDDNAALLNLGDLLTYNLYRTQLGDGSSLGSTTVPIGTEDQVLVVEDNEGSLGYKVWGNIQRVFHVRTNGVDDATDPNRGINYFKPFKTLRFALEQADDDFEGTTSIKISAGEYQEVLPLIVPARTAIVGEELRSTTIRANDPIEELSEDAHYTIDTLLHIGGLIDNIVLGSSITPTPGNTQDQILINPATSTEALIVSNLWTDIINIINYRVNSTGIEPTITGSNIPSTNPARLAAITILEANRNFIKAESLAYISQEFTETVSIISTTAISTTSIHNFTENTSIVFEGTSSSGITVGRIYYIKDVLSSTSFTISESKNGPELALTLNNVPSMTVRLNYNQSLCSRDIDRYIDALKYDLLHPGNYKSVYAGRYYANAVTGSQLEDMFYVRDTTGIRNLTLKGLSGTLPDLVEGETYRIPTGGSFVSLDPGWGPDDERTWVINRSCYVQNVTTFGTAAIGQKIDGLIHNGGNKSIVSNDFTQVISDGIGAWVQNGGRAELVSVFTYYAHIGMFAKDGGIIRATNGNSSYGDFGAVADGIDPDETVRFGKINTRTEQAQVETAFAGEINDFILALEFSNCGQSYTTADYTIESSGTGATAYQEEFRDNAMYTCYVTESGDGFTQYGNQAQAGNTTTITLATSETVDEVDILGMRIILISGEGTGQYGYVQAYNSLTKVVTVYKESTNEIGWDNILPGTPSNPILTTGTRYRIEPRVTFTAPPTSVESYTIGESQAWAAAVFGETSQTFTGVTGSSGTGNVIETVPAQAEFTVIKSGREYSLTLTDGGAGYAVGDTVVIDGADVGGTSLEHDITITVTVVSNDSTNSIIAFDYAGNAVADSGKFVLTTSNANLVGYSSDGENWSYSTLPSAGNWKCLAAGNNKFVAIRNGSNAAASSTDGITWTARTMPSTRGWNGVAYGKPNGFGGLFVAVASNLNSAAYSTNGETWTASTLPTFGDSTLNEYVDIAFGYNKFIALANSGNIAASGVWNGTNLTWTGNVMDVIADSSAKDWVSIAYGNRRFVAISSTGEVSYSLDGDVWYGATLPSQDGSTSHNWKQIRYGQGVFFAVGDTGSRTVGNDPTTGPTTFAAKSYDGVVWETVTLENSLDWGVVAFGNPDITLNDSSATNSKPMFVTASTTSSNILNRIFTGARALGRVVVDGARIARIKIWEPGSGYVSLPTATFTDPSKTVETEIFPMLADGVLAQPTFTNKGSAYKTSTTFVTISGDGFADIVPVGRFITVDNLTVMPGPGAQFYIAGDSDYYTAVVVDINSVTLPDGTIRSTFQVSPRPTLSNFLEHDMEVLIRERYSQVRITGHDFLDVGSGNFIETNYPVLYQDYQYNTEPFQEVQNLNGGRVFYTSTDQDGNFRAGELFAVEQATGFITVSADFFDLQGLTELRLGGITVGSTAVVREFSKDPLFLQDSNNVIPTQRAVRAYLQSRLNIGGEDLLTPSFIAGTVKVGPNLIDSTANLTVEIPVVADFYGSGNGVSGSLLAQTMFVRGFGPKKTV